MSLLLKFAYYTSTPLGGVEQSHQVLNSAIAHPIPHTARIVAQALGLISM